jgi:hypothetical protein
VTSTHHDETPHDETSRDETSRAGAAGAAAAEAGTERAGGPADVLRAVVDAVCDVAEERAVRAQAMWQTLGPLVVAGVTQLATQQAGDAVRVAAAAGLHVSQDVPGRFGEAAGRVVRAAGDAWVANAKEAGRWAALWRP